MNNDMFAIVSLAAQGVMCIILYLWKKSDKSLDQCHRNSMDFFSARLNDNKSLLMTTQNLIKLQIERAVESDKQLAILNTRLDNFVTRGECAAQREKCLCKKIN